MGIRSMIIYFLLRIYFNIYIFLRYLETADSSLNLFGLLSPNLSQYDSPREI